VRGTLAAKGAAYASQYQFDFLWRSYLLRNRHCCVLDQ